MKEHQDFKTLKMVESVNGPIIKLNLRHLKIWWDGSVHDLEGERRVCAELHLEGIGKSDLEGLELMTHIIDLTGEVSSSQFSGKEGLMKIRGLHRES